MMEIIGGDDNNMGFLGIAAFILIVSHITLNDKVKKLREDVRVNIGTFAIPYYYVRLTM